MNTHFRISALAMLLIGCGCFMLGCSHVQPRIYEGSCDRPYVALGIAEVSVKAPRKILKGECAVEKAEKRAAQLKRKLNKALVERSKKLYQADAVSKIQYWPALDSLDFGQEEVFARAEMVRYEPFPATSNPQESAVSDSSTG